MRKKTIVISGLIGLAIVGIVVFSIVRFSELYRRKKVVSLYTFSATVLEIENDTMIVEPIEGSQELNCSDQYLIPINNLECSDELKIGSMIEITFNGLIQETYPARLDEIYSVKIVE